MDIIIFQICTDMYSLIVNVDQSKLRIWLAFFSVNFVFLNLSAVDNNEWPSL